MSCPAALGVTAPSAPLRSGQGPLGHTSPAARPGREAALAVRDLEVRYGPLPALGGITLTVPEGQFLLLSGPSGCGKSTLALAVCGLIPEAPEAHLRGSVSVFGQDTRDLPPHRLARHCGIVFQNPAAQLFHGMVEDEVAFAPRNLGLPEEEVGRRVALALQGVGIGHLAGRLTQSLSAGEKQRLAIAAALSLQPRLLVLDEPAANLDGQGVELLAHTLGRLNREQGLTVLLVEHRLRAFLPLADRLLLLEAGRLAADGPPEEVLRLGPRRSRLGLEAAAPRSGPSAPAARGPQERAALVRLQGVCAGYGRRQVLRQASLDLYPGELTALVGPNGSGKSTLARVLAGMHRPRRGAVRWGRAWRRLPAGRRVGLLFQNAACQLLMDTVGEEVAFAPRNLRLDVTRCARRALSWAGLQRLRERRTACLSVGEQQRTALAAVLAAAPALLILDEPTVGQDWVHLRRLIGFVRQLARGGTSVLLITHDEHLVSGLAQRVIRLEAGRPVEGGCRPEHTPPRGRGQEDLQ